MNRNIMNGGNDLTNIFTQTFNAVINNTDLIDGIVNSLFNSNFLEEVNETFSEGFNGGYNNGDSIIKVNIRDENDKYLIEGEFPGIDRQDIKIDYKDNYIYLNVKRKQVFSNGCNMAMMVMQFGDEFSREFFVPNADATKLRASYKNYRLRLELPKYRKEIVGNKNDNLTENEDNIIDVVDYEEE
ncbi:Hsp20 family protein [Clostridium sardiniense]|uniref:Hsp20 family protein n=1 Tax=Clostridium sardiniense TaxID=29369 RepID=A0ABS7KYV8_CLOSR|nr:Hsp20 family protein [Clostridium sardiniense]MBY0756000.1 Hsp20 family protein [Clostridium sardiniense]MDQ0460709.1 HSP20 family protein [Clostridium sardiniense]